MSKRIVVAEDDPHIRLGLVEALTGEGYEVFECRDGGQALAMIRQLQPGLVILDIMLPRRNGYDICRDLRSEKNGVPILMLTAKSQETDKVIGLELGADDYVTKPFGLRELLARVHALLRRAQPGNTATAGIPDHLQLGEVSIDTRALRGKRPGADFALTPRELAVLALLHRERGHAVSRDRILNEVWGIDYYGTTRTLDQVIVKIRQKIEAQPSEPRHLLTVHGLGYRLEA
ncbi:MAG TPA: response regulator transcription factor [Terrimicrobiaceae bacterium]|nr:response regulator transcription factor [Terrimicrobiaceae bacterium]